MTEVAYTEVMAGQALGAKAQEPAVGPGGALRVVFVNMPFASYRQPSLALGILKAVTRPLAARVMVVDANLMFAEMISPGLYEAIATWPAQDLLGDWVFSAARSCAPGRMDGEYEEHILAGGLGEHQAPHFGKPPMTTHLRRGLRQARRLVEDLLTQCLDEIIRAEPDIVGFTAMFHQLSASLALAERVKAAMPTAVVVLGGASCRGEMGGELLASFPFVDEVVVGEGERAISDLVLGKDERRLSSAPHLKDRLGAGDAHCVSCAADELSADMNLLPYPDYEDYFAAVGEERSRRHVHSEDPVRDISWMLVG